MKFIEVTAHAKPDRWININNIEWFMPSYMSQTATIKLLGQEATYQSKCQYDEFLLIANGTHDNKAVKDAYDNYMIIKKLAQ